ncbi:MAG TPA: hypothetical protein VFY70_09160 [Thermomicrobiales bacterium]|nr:hypothetical protein [Thermomicrobiales bacterium]
MRGWRALTIAPLATLLATGPVLAQDGTPEADGAENPRLVAPSECVAEPQAYEDIAAILNLDGDGVPAPAMTQITPPLGEIADVKTSISIKEAARAVVACFNAGDIPRAAGLMTENGVRRAYWGLTIDADNRELARTRIAAPQQRTEETLVRLITVTDISVLPDGRVTAFVVLNEPLLPPSGPETLLFVFANQDGRWLVDDWIDFSIVPPDFGEEATPTS